jgi:hypothetical protein
VAGGAGCRRRTGVPRPTIDPRSTTHGLRSTILIGLALLAASGAGCRSHSDLVEAELRSRDHDLRELRDEVHRLESYNDSLQREIHSLRHDPASAPPPEAAAQHFSLKSVSLGRQTGGHHGDDCPGDDGLQVVLEPLDGDGHTIKAPGLLQVHALEVNPEGVKKMLSSWFVPPEKLRTTWRSGLLSTGYFVVLPWKLWPSTERLRVVAQFTLTDGRTFEADKDITVRLPPVAKRKQLPPTPEVPVEPVPVPVPVPEPVPIPTLPPPRKVEPPTEEMPLPPEGAQPAGLWHNPWSSSEPVLLLKPVPMRKP